MRISKLRIENLRAFKDVTIPFDRYACLVGANGSGKSTVLHALNIFFRQSADVSTNVTNLQDEDFHQKNTSQPVTITVTFVGLNADAQKEFEDYYRLGELTVSAKAEFNPSLGTAEVHQYGLRKGINDFRQYFEREKQKALVKELKEIYESLRTTYPDLPAAKRQADMKSALQEYESGHPDLCTLIESSDQFYGFTKGTDRLQSHIQWIFIPAVKDVLTEQTEARNTALGRVLDRTVRAKLTFSDQIAKLKESVIGDYTAILGDNMTELSSLSSELQEKLREWAHPNTTLRLEWKNDPEGSVKFLPPLAEIVTGEGRFEGKLARFGHGLQRCYLFSLLHVLSKCDDSASPTLLLGCEEPELFQHPPQLRHLVSVFRQLSQQNSQVILCTHSPYFVSGKDFEDVRLIRKDQAVGEASISYVNIDKLAESLTSAYPKNRPQGPNGTLAKIHQSLQPELNEMFFAQSVVLVEGPEDQAYITSYLHLMDKWNEYRLLGCHIVPVGGKSSLVKPLAIANLMGIPCFVVFDSDGHIDVEDQSKRTKHEKDNQALLKLLGRTDSNPFPSDTLWEDNFVMWKSEITTVVKDELKPLGYDAILESTRKRYGAPGGIEKNSLFIADALEAAWTKGGSSDSLTRLCQSILTFANRQVGKVR